MPATERVMCAVLAAGAGRRMLRPKAEIVVGGERLLDRAVRSCEGLTTGRVLAVVRSGVTAGTADAIVNPNPDRGLRSSLDLAVTAATGADALLVMLVDTPGVTREHVRAVLDARRLGRITIATRDGAPGHPVVMDLNLWREALDLADADEGARALLRARPDLVDAVAVTGDPADLDTPADLQQWRERHGE